MTSKSNQISSGVSATTTKMIERLKNSAVDSRVVGMLPAKKVSTGLCPNQ